MNLTIFMERTMPLSEFDLNEVLAHESMIAHFQPIISVRKKAIVGYEGLARGIHPVTGGIIPPPDLFYEASKKGLTLDLDRLCRKKVLEYFREIAADRPGCLLSLNFEASVIDGGVVGSGNLIHQTTAMGLNPASIAIEIIESNVQDIGDLQKFIQTYRDYGFLIALDDVGAGHSNLNRIPLLKPDILKIDRYLIHDIHEDFHKQEVFKSLVGLAHKIGALILAEGIEKEEEGLYLVEAGVDLVQGYYFSRPRHYGQINDQGADERMDDLFRKFKTMVIQKLNVKRFNLKKYELMTREIQIELSKAKPDGFDQKLSEMVHYFPVVECFYVLDDAGIQVSETIFGKIETTPKNRLIFRPAPKGTDHTMKDYFYMLIDGGLKKSTFISEPYLSLATGNSCITFARIFKDAEERIRILCVDINTEYLQQISLA